MFLLLDNQCKEIAELLDCGERVFVNKETGNILSHPDFDKYGNDTEEFYEEVLEELDNNFTNYWEVEQPSSRDSFEIMENFINQLEESNRLKVKLIKALSNKKPFANFIFEIDNSGVYRQKWFEFKNEQLKNWVIEKYNELKKD
jgi:hypothetical protein